MPTSWGRGSSVARILDKVPGCLELPPGQEVEHMARDHRVASNGLPLLLCFAIRQPAPICLGGGEFAEPVALAIYTKSIVGRLVGQHTEFFFDNFDNPKKFLVLNESWSTCTPTRHHIAILPRTDDDIARCHEPQEPKGQKNGTEMRRVSRKISRFATHTTWRPCMIHPPQ